MIGLSGVAGDGMPGKNAQRKLGTTRGSPRRSRTAKASRISRYAVKSRCARRWGGWGRLSDDGARQHNSGESEDPWGGGLPNLHGGARSSARPDTARDYRCRSGVRERRTQTADESVYAGSRLKLVICGKVPPYMPAFQPYRGKPAVRNDRGDRGNVGIIRSPVRASILPDCGGRAMKPASLPLRAHPTRRAVLFAAALTTLWHRAGWGQESGRTYRLGILSSGATRQAPGWVVFFDYRWAEADDTCQPGLAAELVGLPVDLILTWGTAAALASKRATATIPIVMGSVGDPVKAGI